MKNIFLKILIYIVLIVLAVIFKLDYLKYTFLFVAIFLDFIFLINTKYIENVSFYLSNKFIKEIKIFLNLINIEIDCIFVLAYLSSFFNFLKILYILVSLIVITIVIFTIYVIKNINKETIIFRKAKENEKEKVLKIYTDGAKALKEDKVNQWQDKYYPTMKDVDEHILKDLFVLEYKNEIVATASLVEGIDKDYENINGKWNTNTNYISIHKFATKNEFKKQGFAKKLMSFIEIYAKKNSKNLRIDTHENNEKMKYFILSSGFSYCGVVFLQNELKRLAYDKKIVK